MRLEAKGRRHFWGNLRVGMMYRRVFLAEAQPVKTRAHV